MRNSLSDMLYYSTVRIQNDKGLTGTGYFIATGSIYPGVGKVFLVSNNHVVKPDARYSITFHSGSSLNPKIKSGMFIHHFKYLKWKNDWKSHPNPDIDIAIMDFTPYIQHFSFLNKFVFFKAIPLDSIPNQEEIDIIKSIEDIIFVGYPNGLIDRANNLPIARKGSLATPLHENFDNLPLFLIDASVFGGSSGSPVCILNDGGSYTLTTGNTVFGSRFFLIGILFKTHKQGHDQQNIDLGIAWKAHCILETLEHHFLPNIISLHKNLKQQHV